MNNQEMMAALQKLPVADLMQASAITDPIGADTYYSARTVVQLLAQEREMCAAIVDIPAGFEAWEVIGGQEGMNMLRELAQQIRSGAAKA